MAGELTTPLASSLDWLVGGGETGELVRTMDWSCTDLGPIVHWPASLRTAVSLALASSVPMAIAWGPSRVLIYNDAYRSILGGKHPVAMGQDFEACWSTAWPAIAEAVEGAAANRTTSLADQRMFLERHGRIEETFFTCSFSPIRDETGQVAGLFHPITETSARLLAERRLDVLRELSDGSPNVRRVDDAVALVVQTLARHQLDVPFAALYLLDREPRVARLAGVAHVDAGTSAAPRRIALDDPTSAWPLGRAIATGRLLQVDDVSSRLGAMGCGPYPESPRRAMVVPLGSSGRAQPIAVLVAGVSARNPFDTAYRTFFGLLQQAIFGALFGAHEHEHGQNVADSATSVGGSSRALLDDDGELRFREMADNAPAMLWITDTWARCTFLSRAWCEYTGQTQAEGLGFGWTRVIHPADRERVAAEFATASERRQAFSLDYRLRRCDGEYRWVIDSARPRFGPEGRFIGYVGSVIDVHERKEAEDALRAREELVRTIAENSTQALVMLDDRGYCTYANRAWLRMTGYDAHEIRAAPLHDLVHHHHPDGRPYARCDCPINRALPENRAVRAHEDEFFRKDGTTFPVACAASPVYKDGAPVSTVLEVRDITAAKQAERALRRQSEHLGLLWEAAAVIVTSEDPDTMLRRIFARIREGLGLDAYFHFVVDESGTALRRASHGGIAPEHADCVARLEFGEGLSGTMALERRPIVATRIQASDDPRAKLLKGLGIRTFAGNPLIASGRLLGTLAFASHERDAFRPDELEFLETISHYVTAAYEQFRLIEQLREADRKKDEFLATLAHELRNPLAPIRTGLRVLRLSSPGSAIAEQSLAIMERQSSQLTRLIDDLLDVSRITQGKLQVRKTYVELSDVVQSALETARPFIDEARHDLVVDLPAEPVMLCADLTRLAQVLSNLLSNAAKYTSRGGKIELGARREGSEVVLWVRDNGLGIEAHMLERVFDKFTQIDRSSEPAYTGLGIGLTLVKSLVEMHDGTVTVRSDGVGEGSEFTVRLPCVVGRFEVSAAVEPPAEPARALPKQRVLVVDDNQDAAELLSVAVEMLGHEVRTAHDGVEAIAMAQSFEPNIVLMDLGMPRMNGYEAARRIREEPWGERITLVALTGWGQEADRRKSKAAGFDHHLVKPAEPATLEAILGGDIGDR